MHNVQDDASVSKTPGPNLVWVPKKNDQFVVAGHRKKMKVMWIVDNGCSRHMTGDKALLSHFEEESWPNGNLWR